MSNFCFGVLAASLFWFLVWYVNYAIKRELIRERLEQWLYEEEHGHPRKLSD